MKELGRLQKVELRKVWDTEDRDFTPWLAHPDNISVLSDTLGLELEVEAQEKNVGPFRADILCRDTHSDSYVLIENQLEKTDHTHLGQLMTYAAGLDTVTIVWIASKFREEHRAAIDWLNKISAEEFRFFGLEIELWQIGDSPAAPKFNLVSKPNEWSRSIARAGREFESVELTETKKLQLEYWQGLHSEMEGKTKLSPRKPRPRHWTTFSIGRSGIHLGAIINTRENRIGVELYLGDENANHYYLQLREDKEQIESDLGFAPHWRELPNKRACRIIVYYESIDFSDKSKWPIFHEWTIENLQKFDFAFRKRVRSLDLADYQIES